MRALALALVLIASPAAAQDSRLLKVTRLSIGVTAALEGGDLAQSMYALGKLQTADERRKKELNLLYAPFDDRPLLTGLVKAGGGAVSGYLLARYSDDHPRIVLLTSLALNGLYVWVVDHNRRVTRAVR